MTTADQPATATLSGREIALMRRQAMAQHGKSGLALSRPAAPIALAPVPARSVQGENTTARAGIGSPASLAARSLGVSPLSQSFTGQVSFFPQSQFSLTASQESYADAVFGCRSMATPRQRGSWSNLRGVSTTSINPWPTLIPLFIASSEYLSRYMELPTEFFTLVPAETVPFPEVFVYPGWKRENAPRYYNNNVPAPPGSQQALFQLGLDVYGVCLVPAEGTLESLIPWLKFGDVVDGLDSFTLSGDIPLTHGMASTFVNPWFGGRNTLGTYQDSLNGPVLIDRSGTFSLNSSSR